SRVEQAWAAAALSLQEYRLLCVLRRTDDAEAEEIRSSGGHGQCGDLGPSSLHDGVVAFRALSEDPCARQDRLLHGGLRLRGVAQSLDQKLREYQRPGGAGDEGEVPPAGGQGDGEGDSGQARFLQRRSLSAALVADGRADGVAADGGSHSGTAEVINPAC